MIPARNNLSSRPLYAVRWNPTDAAPADSPQIVTSEGQPWRSASRFTEVRLGQSLTSEGSDILLYPVQSQTLVFQSNIGLSSLHHFIAIKEAKRTESTSRQIESEVMRLETYRYAILTAMMGLPILTEFSTIKVRL